MKQLHVNGEPKQYAEEEFPGSLLALIEALGADPATVVAEVDGAVIRKDRFAQTPLHDGAKVELVQFVGGG